MAAGGGTIDCLDFVGIGGIPPSIRVYKLGEYSVSLADIIKVSGLDTVSFAPINFIVVRSAGVGYVPVEL